MSVATEAESGCRSGGAASGRAAWWDEEQQLSPINSPYLSLPFNAAPPDSHCLIMWRLHLLLYEFHFMKIIFSCCLLFFIFFFTTFAAKSQRATFWEFSYCAGPRFCSSLQDEQSLLFLVLLFWFCLRIAISYIFPGEWMNVSCHALSVSWNKGRRKKSKVQQKRKHNAEQNNFSGELQWILMGLCRDGTKQGQSQSVRAKFIYSVKFMICFS